MNGFRLYGVFRDARLVVMATVCAQVRLRQSSLENSSMTFRLICEKSSNRELEYENELIYESIRVPFYALIDAFVRASANCGQERQQKWSGAFCEKNLEVHLRTHR